MSVYLYHSEFIIKMIMAYLMLIGTKGFWYFHNYERGKT